MAGKSGGVPGIVSAVVKILGLREAREIKKYHAQGRRERVRDGWRACASPRLRVIDDSGRKGHTHLLFLTASRPRGSYR